MAKLKYRSDIAPQIIEEARKRIFNSFIEKGYIDNTELVPIKSIEDCSIEICSSISMKMTGYFMKTKPEEVNIYAPIYSSLLSVLVGMELTNEWAKGNKEIPENIYDEMIEESSIDTFDEYLLEKIGIEYESEEYNELLSFINKTYCDNWIYINEEAKRKGLGTQILFVVDSLMIMLSIGVQIEKKRLGL